MTVFDFQTPLLDATESDSSRLSLGRFSTEAELVDKFSKTIRPNESMGVSFEFDCTYGVADIVLYHLTASGRVGSSLQDLPDGWAYALTLLPYRKVFSTADLQEVASASRAYTLKMLKLFTDAGFVRMGKIPDTWIKYRQPRAVVRDMTAIEAKLSDWRRALYQATRYLQFAHFSWVLLDSASARSAINNIDQFRWYNVGLASIGGSGLIITHHKPERREPKSPHLFWMANVKVAREIFNQDSSLHIG